tara:strand:+ start:355 stop:780 length:426 start_codon:yes stop_codon:yes gene_type:complete
MKKILLKSLFFLIAILYFNLLNAETSFLKKGKKLYDAKKYNEAKLLFEKDLVYNPKSETSYLYLAKIFNKKDKEKLEENNLNTVILLNPKNEEAIYDLILLNINRSNFSKADELIKTFDAVCVNLCNSSKKIKAKLKDSLN